LIIFGIEVIELSGAIETQIMTAGQYEHIFRLGLAHGAYFVFLSGHENSNIKTGNVYSWYL
jgi:hypothetical protein